MAGSVLFAVVIVVILVIAGIAMSPFFLIPAVIVLLVALFAAPLFGAIARGGSGPGETSTPSTTDAAYDPVAEPMRDPGERRV